MRSEIYGDAMVHRCYPENGPQTILNEDWFEVGEEGAVGGIGLARGPDGLLLRYVEMMNGVATYTDMLMVWQIGPRLRYDRG